MTRTTLLLAITSLFALPVCAQSSGNVVISEIMLDPSDVPNGEGEYIELYNTTSTEITLSGWTLNIDGDPDDLSDVTVPAEGFAVLCIDDDAASNGGINCALDYPDDHTLNNSGSTVSISNSTGTEVDRVSYDDGTDWPNIKGSSMEFIGDPGDDNNVAAHWQEATTRKGDFAGMTGDFGSPNTNASGGALPVELVSFEVSATAEGAMVTWATASETNNARFAVEHRGPERAAYQTLGTRAGAGTSTRQRSYRLGVQGLAPGPHTFRLKQVDVDGTVHRSAPRTVSVLPEAELQIIGANPLRAGEQLTVVAKGPPDHAVRVGLYNVLGQRIRTLSSPSKGTMMRVQLSASSLPSGTYFVRTEGGAGGATARFTVVR
jgi:hypothetical protein